MQRFPSSAARRATHRGVTLPFLLAALGVTACGSPPSQAPPVDEIGSQSSDHIEWFTGEVEEAFAQAEELGKPLFLYWGAEWCPPCHYLKNKIFSRPEFLDRISKFVPVYLDGDTERAQIWGERLDVQGYPTVIVFNTSGDEVVRLSSSVPVDQYAAVLDEAVSTTRSIQEILDSVLEAGPANAPVADLLLLANYSWAQASDLRQDPAELTEAFRILYEETPESRPIERSRFLAAYVAGLIHSKSDSGATGGEFESASDPDLLTPVLALLEDRRLREANLVFASYGVASKIELLEPEPGERRERLVRAWKRAASEIEADESLSVDDRLGGTLARVTLHTLPAAADSSGPADVELSPEIQASVRDRVAWALQQVDDPSELQSVVNTLAHILQTASLDQEAENLLIDTMDRTTAPYYFMEWVADLREDAGDTEAALAWYRQAYDASRGSYSRFRYGSIYLRRLMELEPDRIEAVQRASIEILTELLEHSDAFAGGNYSRLSGLESAYREWKPEREGKVDALAEIRRVVLLSCEQFSLASEDDQRNRCQAFLEPNPSDEIAM